LIPDLDDGSRWRLLLDEAAALGWRARPGPFRRLSICAPWRRIYIAREVWADPAWRVAVLAHELEHARRQRARGPARWTACYLARPSVRRCEEIRAEAHEAAVRSMMSGRRPEDSVRTRLGGWRLPYLAGGDSAELEARAAKGAAALVHLAEQEKQR